MSFSKVSRREFLGRFSAGAVAGAVTLGASRHGAVAASKLASWTPPPVLNQPNILIIIVDQMRFPVWMSPITKSLSQVLPNIVGRIQSRSYNFTQYFTAATVCTPSRSTLLTGLYSPQTAIYITGGEGSAATQPALNTAYPTWGQAISRLNPAYQDNVWWFGKWHLSNNANSTPLLPYGFRTRTYPGGPSAPYNPSPNGTANEGTNGGRFGNQTYASDSMISGDFVGWLKGHAPTAGAPKTPWCATVSFVNPHDITYAPAWLQSSPFPPTGVPLQKIYFPPPSGPPPDLYTVQPSPWNYEDLPNVPNKPSLQLAWKNSIDQRNGPVTDWVLFLNQYFWLQSFVDAQVGVVLNALSAAGSPRTQS